MNRAAKRARLFEGGCDYLAVENLLLKAKIATRMRLLAYCIMPNHWHLILWPTSATQMSQFMRRFTGNHAQLWQHARSTVGSGAVYQGRYKAIPIQTGTYFYNACRYVERNPLRSDLVHRAEDWPWSSAWRRAHAEEGELLDRWPTPCPHNWLETLNAAATTGDVDTVRAAIQRNVPLGDPEWAKTTTEAMGLTGRLPGRPRKPAEKNCTRPQLPNL
jgi:putative transposase